MLRVGGLDRQQGYTRQSTVGWEIGEESGTLGSWIQKKMCMCVSVCVGRRTQDSERWGGMGKMLSISTHTHMRSCAAKPSRL